MLATTNNMSQLSPGKTIVSYISPNTDNGEESTETSQRPVTWQRHAVGEGNAAGLVVVSGGDRREFVIWAFVLKQSGRVSVIKSRVVKVFLDVGVSQGRK